ncbi:hypothetical protein [Mycobacterium innocens]|nr:MULTISPECIES: hypothetical protein [Mycobacterium]
MTARSWSRWLGARRYRLDDINTAYTELCNGEIICGIIDFDVR